MCMHRYTKPEHVFYLPTHVQTDASTVLSSQAHRQVYSICVPSPHTCRQRRCAQQDFCTLWCTCANTQISALSASRALRFLIHLHYAF
jgi:hypothetical protein